MWNKTSDTPDRGACFVHRRLYPKVLIPVQPQFMIARLKRSVSSAGVREWSISHIRQVTHEHTNASEFRRCLC